MKFGSPNSQTNTIRQVMKGLLLFTTLKVLSSRSIEPSEQYSQNLADLEKIIKCNISKKLNKRRRLLRLGEVNVDNDHNLNYDAFQIYTNDNKSFCRKRIER